MRVNNILANMKAGKVSTGCQIAFPSTPLMELMGIAGIDFVLIDGEHGTFSWEAIDDMCRVADLAGVTPIARVPNIDPSTILRYLDRGVQGVFGPGIDSREDAQQLVDACYYAPKGTRGLGGAPRAAGYATLADAGYIDSANEQMLVVAFLEHVTALENLDEIMEVEGVHAYYVGPQDMSVSMGLGGRPDHPRIAEASDMVRKAAEAKGRKYLGPDVFLADRASNFFLNGIAAFMEAHKDELG